MNPQPLSGRHETLYHALQLFGGFFLLSLATGMLTLAFLPQLSSDISPDSLRYFYESKELSILIEGLGMHFWTIRPAGQGPVGLGSLIFLLLPVSHYSIQPFLAFTHALCGVTLWATLRVLTGYSRTSITITTLILLFLLPSSILLNAFLNKDVFSMLGIFLIMLALALASIQRKKIYN